MGVLIIIMRQILKQKYNFSKTLRTLIDSKIDSAY